MPGSPARVLIGRVRLVAPRSPRTARVIGVRSRDRVELTAGAARAVVAGRATDSARRGACGRRAERTPRRHGSGSPRLGRPRRRAWCANPGAASPCAGLPASRSAGAPSQPGPRRAGSPGTSGGRSAERGLGRTSRDGARPARDRRRSPRAAARPSPRRIAARPGLVGRRTGADRWSSSDRRPLGRAGGARRRRAGVAGLGVGSTAVDAPTRRPPDARPRRRACAASRRAQSWKVGQTGKRARQAVRLLVGERARCRAGFGVAAVAMIRARAIVRHGHRRTRRTGRPGHRPRWPALGRSSSR